MPRPTTIDSCYRGGARLFGASSSLRLAVSLQAKRLATMNDLDFNLRNAHPRDRELHFDAATHTYMTRGIELDSVSNVIASHFPAFDAEMWSRIKARERGVSPSRIREEWHSRGAKASELGTHLHAQIEHWLQGEPVELAYSFIYQGQYVREDEVISLYPEWQQFQHFTEEIIEGKGYSSYRTEWRIYDEEHRIAGTLDYLVQDHRGEFILFDWKRSEKLGSAYGRSFIPRSDSSFGTGLEGLAHLTNSPYNRYALQQNLYRHILQSRYGIQLKEMYLVVLSPLYQYYHLVPVPRMDEEVAYILESQLK